MFNYKRLFILMVLMSLLMTIPTHLWAQDDDELEDEMTETVEVKCTPDSLTTPWDKILASDSTLTASFNTNISFANEYYTKKNYDRAIPLLWKVMLANKSAKYNQWALTRLLKSYYNRARKLSGEQAVANMDSALIMAYRGLELNAKDITMNYWAGFIHSLLRHYSCAIPHYEFLVKSQATNKGYWTTLANLYANTKDWEKAMNTQQKVVEMDQKDLEAKKKLEIFTQQAGGSLRDVYKKNWDSQPDNPEYAYKYGDASLTEGEFGEALKAFRAALKLKTKARDIYKKIAEAYKGLPNNSKAIANYKVHIKNNPTDVQAMIELGDLYRDSGNFQTAVSYAYKALRSKAGFGEAYLLIARTYIDAVRDCSSKRKKAGINYDDKLIYEKAYSLAARAKKDPIVMGRANNLMNNLKNSLPSKEDRFLHQQRKKVKDPCYSWIK